MLGHFGINVSALSEARNHYDGLMPLVGFEPSLCAEDEFAYEPADNKPDYYATFWYDPLADQDRGRLPPRSRLSEPNRPCYLQGCN